MSISISSKLSEFQTSPVTSQTALNKWQEKGNGLKMQLSRFILDTKKNFFTKDYQALKQAAQGNGGVAVPRGI